MSGRSLTGYLLLAILLPGVLSLSKPLSAQPDGGGALSPASASLSTARRHLRLPNGSLLVFEQLDAWHSAAVCLSLAVPRAEQQDEQAILTHLAARVLSSASEAGLPGMVAEGEFVEEGFRCRERGQAILLGVEASPEALERVCELLAGVMDFNPRPEELAWYIGRAGGGPRNAGAGAEVIELLRDLAAVGAPRSPRDRPPHPLPDGEQLRAFLSALREPANVTVSLCAPNVSEATVSFLAQLFSLRPPGSVKPERSDTDSSPPAESGAVSVAQRVTRLPRAGPLVKMCLGFSLPCNSRKEYWAARALVAALGGPRFSRLYQGLRREQGLAYSLDTRVEWCKGRAAAVVECLVPREASEQAEDLLLAEADRLTARGLSDGEFRRAKEYLKGLVLGLWQHPLDAAIQNADEAAALQSDIDMTPWAVIDSLTKDEVNSAARRIGGNWFLCVYG